MPQIERIPHPRHSDLWTHYVSYDFLDGYAVQSDLPLDDAIERAFVPPKWLIILAVLRRHLLALAPVTSKLTDNAAHVRLAFETENEVVSGFVSRHLVARISLLRFDGRIYMAAWMHPRSMWGRAFMIAVTPFVLSSLRKRVIRIGA